MTVLSWFLALVAAAAMVAMAPYFTHTQAPLPIYLAWGVLAVGISAATVRAVARVPDEHARALTALACAMMAAFACEMFVVQMVKHQWGRPRYLTTLEGAADWVPWYLPQGLAPNDGFASFPSGHTADATMMLALALAPICFPAPCRAGRWLLALGVAWPIAVGWARITIGAHRLSDGTAGTLVSIFFMVLFAHLWVRPGRISEANKPIRQ